ncbi:hypothetical protein Afil01_50310 [Actinorhabdospora filicis]|uniref:DUF1963 domain-containing protein n=1 Tax=Actinorhabdospora filicis TaxID=1785913 RepID=A0A9W6WB28_9ACTN|nr:hypothetical protein [Actinorhabdospora filicis]GLZ80224.1 hypothetical protein Afil01_50310 [Actinorhabdospora filicis]
MVTLLTYAGPAAPDAHTPRTGGVPLAPAGFQWPVCRTCGGAMMFLAHLPSAEGAVAVFMCQNDPGLCQEWDPAQGGNAAYVFTGPLGETGVPEKGQTRLPEAAGLTTTEVDAADYATARQGWAAATGRSPREVLGKLGGAPEWIQGDETPTCQGCGAPMDFGVQLEEGRDPRTGMNFGGGGRGYVFACGPCDRAAFVWQC